MMEKNENAMPELAQFLTEVGYSVLSGSFRFWSAVKQKQTNHMNIQNALTPMSTIITSIFNYTRKSSRTVDITHI